jgi:hypothetical protein
VSTPYFPQAPIFPQTGLANNAFIDAEQAKALLAQVSPDYLTNPQAKAQMDAYVQQVALDEGLLTPRRVAEIGVAARTIFGGQPEAIARNHAVQAGKAVPFDRLPPDMAENFRRRGLTEEEVAEQITRTTMYERQDLTPLAKIEKFIAAAHMHPDAASRADIAAAEMAARAGTPAPQAPQVPPVPNTPTQSVRQNIDGSTSIRGEYYGIG